MDQDEPEDGATCLTLLLTRSRRQELCLTVDWPFACALALQRLA